MDYKQSCPECKRELKSLKQSRKIYTHGKKGNAKYLKKGVILVCFNPECSYLKHYGKRLKLRL